MSPTDRPDLVEYLKRLRDGQCEDGANNNLFKRRAYNKVIDQLVNVKTELPVTWEGFKALGVSGVGEGIGLKIQEWYQGNLRECATGKEQGAIALFMEIQAIGPVKAADLVNKHRIYTLEDLVAKQDELLNVKQRMGLKYHGDFKERIPRTEMDKHAAFLDKAIRAVDPNIRYEFAGSYRRGLASSGDIDVLITHDQFIEKPHLLSILVEKLQSAGYLTDTFAIGESKYNGVAKLPRHKRYRRIDIMYTDPQRYPFALLYFTGSQQFNIMMRNKALEKGLTLNEYGLSPMGSKGKEKMVLPHVRTEEDVFKELDMDYVAPKDR